jgi:hypothetical protein
MIHGVYIGALPELKGKTALLQTQEHMQARANATVLAQFDDVSTGLGLGWHQFPVTDFELDWLEEDCYED